MAMRSSEAGAAAPRRWGRSRWVRPLAAAALALVVTVAAVFVVASLTTERSYWSRIIAWRDARFDDFATKFAARPIPNGPATYRFRPAPVEIPSYLNTVTYRQNGREVTIPLADFLASTGTTAFLVLKDDQLLYEGYFNGADRSSTQTSFSVAKSFGSALIGIAIAEGSIAGLDDPITRYLPELAGRPGLDQVHIRHLLTMTSGLRYNGTGMGGSPFGDDAYSYYDPDLRALALGVQAEIPPGGRWQYDNFHPLLLGMILERATGRTVSAYLSEKLWQPLGMEAPGSWSLDSRHDGFEKMESGLNGRAIDFAKFGRLYLRGGSWDGRQLVPRAWVEASTRHDPAVAGPATSPPGEEWARSLDYGCLWWLDPRAPGRFFAMGNLGQYIYVAPDRDAVLVRFGTRFGTFEWIGILRDLASRIP
jgi:CubicO group peptidase (beta-lactamase class C family)